MSDECVEPRMLVLCFDGTASQFDTTNTNVVKFFSLLKKDADERQICYYQAGIGEYFNSGVVSPLLTLAAKLLDYAVAWYLDAHIQDGYRFLMKNYRDGDKICLFGFSRGAYIARALAGMLHKVGLLPKDNDEQVNYAYRLYTRTDTAGIALSACYKHSFSRDVKIEFIGVWETIISVGVFMGRSLPFVDSNSVIKTFRHALALDERRARFRPNVYRHPISVAHPSLDSKCSGTSTACCHTNGHVCTHLPGTSSHRTKIITDAMEVWFVGDHIDVGGGSVSDSTPNPISDISLRWMIQEVMASQCGILFDEELLRYSMPIAIENGLFTNGNHRDVDLDNIEAVQPIHDELKSYPIWWLLEYIPLFYSYQDHNGRWRTAYGNNGGRGRIIYGPDINFHVSVKERMEASKYEPKANWERGTEVYVE